MHATKTMNGNGLLVLLMAQTVIVDASFWRYNLLMRSGSDNPSRCTVVPPAVEIRAGGMEVSLHESQGSADCVVANGGNGLDCNGNGNIIFDVSSPDFDVFVNETLAISCSQDATPVFQTINLGLLCPDDTTSSTVIDSCTPGNTFQQGPSGSFCYIETDRLASFTAELGKLSTSVTNDGCVFEEESDIPSDFPSMPPTASPSMIPTLSSAPSSAACGVYNDDCTLASECCSNRCFIGKCQKTIPASKDSLAGTRGGAGGEAKIAGSAGVSRRLRHVRGT